MGPPSLVGAFDPPLKFKNPGFSLAINRKKEAEFDMGISGYQPAGGEGTTTTKNDWHEGSAVLLTSFGKCFITFCIFR